eukprot:GEMP01086609.1.p2 GENE.GEMP01086609.1~~GEMP01086609.1.p2  ORF type:complete len:122 (+),score=3.81 GEMP01086609.1:547-912(+)
MWQSVTRHFDQRAPTVPAITKSKHLQDPAIDFKPPIRSTVRCRAFRKVQKRDWTRHLVREVDSDTFSLLPLFSNVPAGPKRVKHDFLLFFACYFFSTQRTLLVVFFWRKAGAVPALFLNTY